MCHIYLVLLLVWKHSTPGVQHRKLYHMHTSVPVTKADFLRPVIRQPHHRRWVLLLFSLSPTCFEVRPLFPRSIWPGFHFTRCHRAPFAASCLAWLHPAPLVRYSDSFGRLTASWSVSSRPWWTWTKTGLMMMTMLLVKHFIL